MTPTELPKAPTGIAGLDQITGGGLPRGRPTLVCGSAGCGKTLLAIEFLVRGATQFGEPGVLMAFEETAAELSENVRSLGFDLDTLVADKKLSVQHVRVERAEIEETGEYDLEGLFIRLGHAIDTVGARRVVLDTLENLFGGLDNHAVLRAELRRLFRWLKDRGVTAVITGERGEGQLTRQGLEEYVSDCVILLDHRAIDQISTRRLRVVKYRGTTHGTNEYPFLIDASGFAVMPVTALEFQHEVSDERVSTGVPALDAMLGGAGFFRGTTALLSGTAGCGKTSLAVSFVDAACRRGEKALYYAFEESPGQLARNMRSIGIDLRPHLESARLRVESTRATSFGLEMHLALMYQLIDAFEPDVVVVDPVGSLMAAGNSRDAKVTLTRLIDHLKVRNVTALLTNLTSGGESLESTEVGISSLVDTWILLRDIESAGERNRGIYVLKSRGMRHSNQIREFALTDRGIELHDVDSGGGELLTGSARVARAAREAAEELARRQEIEARQRELERKREALEARIEALRRDFEVEAAEAERGLAEDRTRERLMARDRQAIARTRRGENGQPAGRGE